MATLDSLFSQPGMLNRTGVTIKLRSPISDSEIARLEQRVADAGVMGTQKEMLETMKSLKQQAGGGDTIRLAPGQVGVTKTPEYTQEKLRQAATNPLIQSGEYVSPLEEFLAVNEGTPVQQAIRESRFGEEAKGAGVQQLAQNIKGLREQTLEAILGQEGSTDAQLERQGALREALGSTRWDFGQGYEQALGSTLGREAMNRQTDKASGWGDFAKQASGFVLAPFTGGASALIMGGAAQALAQEQAAKKKAAMERQMREQLLMEQMPMGSDIDFNEAFSAAVGGPSNPLDEALFDSSRYRALGGY